MTPNLNNLKSAPLLVNNSNRAFCDLKVVTCTSQEYGIVNYIMYQFRPNAFLTFINEYYNDFSGQHTGFKTQDSEHFIGMTWWIGDVITIRESAWMLPIIDRRSTTVFGMGGSPASAI